jgi:hypothetical protein
MTGRISFVIFPLVVLAGYQPFDSQSTDSFERAFTLTEIRKEIAMSKKIKITIALVAVFAVTALAAVNSQSSANQMASEKRYVAQYNASGEMMLPPNNMWREWLYVGSPLTPNALNGGKAGFPEYHNVYIQPWAYEVYQKTNQFPDGTIMFKELQLTLGPAENSDGSQTEPSGRGYFPGATTVLM